MFISAACHTVDQGGGGGDVGVSFSESRKYSPIETNLDMWRLQDGSKGLSCSQTPAPGVVLVHRQGPLHSLL